MKGLDHSAFDVFTEESAYWVGFLMADGFVSSPSQVGVELHEKDIGHLRKFKEFLSSEHKITERRSAAGLRFCSKRIVLRLAECGVVPRKSHTAQASKEMAADRHFWRGVVDGDGCLSSTRGGFPQLRLYGSRCLVGQFVAYAKTVVPEADVHPTKTASIFNVAFGGRSGARLIQHLYMKASVSLDRKQKMAETFVEASAPWRDGRFRSKRRAV